MFLRAFWEAQMHAYEHAAGWVSSILTDRGQSTLTDTASTHVADLLEL